MDMDPETIAADIIPRIREKHGEDCPPVFVSMSPVLQQIPSEETGFGALVERCIDYVLSTSHPATGIRIGVHEKKRAVDLEKFLSIYPRRWFHLSIESQSPLGYEDGISCILTDLGYHCVEWVGVEGSESQLGAFRLGAQKSPSLILYIQNHGSRRSCDFLIPVVESVAYLAHAI